jgi:hypothetical protein
VRPHCLQRVLDQPCAHWPPCCAANAMSLRMPLCAVATPGPERSHTCSRDRGYLLPAGQRACAWLASVPAADCLRCGDVKALATEYRRVAPLALLRAAASEPRLGSLRHVGADQLRLRDLEVMLGEYKELSMV